MWNRKARHMTPTADNVSVSFKVLFIVCALIEFLIYDNGCHLKTVYVNVLTLQRQLEMKARTPRLAATLQTLHCYLARIPV